MTRNYRWDSPHEWLRWKIDEALSTNVRDTELVEGYLRTLIPTLSADHIQDIFEAEMSDDGYFDKRTFQTGDVFWAGMGRVHYILAHIDHGKMLAISLKDGNRWNSDKVVTIKNWERVTWEEVERTGMNPENFVRGRSK